MKHLVILALKGILLWSTAFSTSILIVGLESLIENKMFLVTAIWTVVNIILWWVIWKTFTYKDAVLVSGKSFFDKYL